MKLSASELKTIGEMFEAGEKARPPEMADAINQMTNAMMNLDHFVQDAHDRQDRQNVADRAMQDAREHAMHEQAAHEHEEAAHEHGDEHEHGEAAHEHGEGPMGARSAALRPIGRDGKESLAEIISLLTTR